MPSSDARDGRLAALVSLLNSYTASANSELDRGGWTADWDEEMRPLRNAIHKILDAEIVPPAPGEIETTGEES